jgi:SAM domain (Sterile alpha motif)
MNIATWLRSLGLEQYEQVFRDNAIDHGIILNLNDTELVSLGIQPLGHRKKLLRAIAALVQRFRGIMRPYRSYRSRYE